jgi:hypothetical protein
LRELKERLGEMVAPGEAFDATDLIETERNRRLIFVWNVGNRWIVATEHGGLGYNDPILAYDLNQDGGRVTLVQERIASPCTVCPTALILLEVGASKTVKVPRGNVRSWHDTVIGAGAEHVGSAPRFRHRPVRQSLGRRSPRSL